MPNTLDSNTVTDFVVKFISSDLWVVKLVMEPYVKAIARMTTNIRTMQLINPLSPPSSLALRGIKTSYNLDR